MRTADIRRTFLSFFEERGHRVVPSSSLVPKDPTMLLTSAGMVQFKPYFLGEQEPVAPRATSVQKCFRTSDIGEVGLTTRHHTFFEMLGNFSFGDYFKREAIRWGWELSVDGFGLDPDRIWLTIYTDDDDAEALCLEETPCPAERIQRLGREENFWWMNVAGPCGPTVELHYDRGPGFGAEGGPAVNGERYLEYYNLVFMQYACDDTGEIQGELPAQNVDTGMGLERIVSILQGVDSNFETDAFRPVIERAEALTGATLGASEGDTRLLRILSDHARGVTFLIADGVVPTNEGRGYVLRRVLRRAITRARRAGVTGEILPALSEVVIDNYAEVYPELERNRDGILQAVTREERQFSETLDRGLQILEQELAAKPERLSGELAFRLYDTYGFPLEITTDVAAEAGVSVDVEGFERHMEEQRSRSRQATASDKAQASESVRLDVPDTVFSGYEELSGEGEVLGLLRGTEPVSVAAADDEVDVVLDRTPFYPEGGGQVGDRGWIEGGDVRGEVLDTQRHGGLVLHRVRVSAGELRVGDGVTLQVDPRHRGGAERAHTATHVVHHTLREVLGEHVRQMGSLVEPGRLRFDFSHFSAVGGDVLGEIEETVNARVLHDDDVRAFETDYRHATEDLGAIAFFDEKYGDVVRVVEVGEYSRELCGGTHVHRSGEVGLVKLTSEGSIGSNLRRVEALTGMEGLRFVNRRLREAERAAELARSTPEELGGAVERLLATQKELERSLQAQQQRGIAETAKELATEARDAGRGRLVVARREEDPDELRRLAVAVREELHRGVVILGRSGNGGANIVGAVSKALTEEGVDARAILKAAAQHIGGGAGGKQPDLAVAGGSEPEGLDRALEVAREEAEGALR